MSNAHTALPPTAPPFVHLHLHSEYSLLDGACRTADVVARAKALGMPAVALTDHGNLYGAIEFYSAAKAAGVKPIIGCELYLAPLARNDREARLYDESNFHLLLLAENLEGYRNLLKLSSAGYLQGFYKKPRIDFDLLRAHSAGLICTSTCLGGLVPRAFMKHDAAGARAAAERFLEIFGPERFFMELQNHNMAEQAELNPELVSLGKRLGVATVATNDVHYLTHDDVEPHDVLCCVSTRTLVSDENRFKFPSDQFYFKTAEEMLAALPEHRDALARTVAIAERCNVEFDFSQRFAPKYDPPQQKTPEEYLRELVLAGARWRYGEITPELTQRIDYELQVIQSKGFSSYFLIVWDFVSYALKNDIPCNARGSGCSTVVGYCLGISNVDPLHYGLYFERFMDPDRDEMPDIDMDMCQDRRPEVIDYVRRKYGHVAQIITFGRLKPRAAIRDVARTLSMTPAEADRIAKLVPEELKITIDKAIKQEPELKRMYEQEPPVRRVLDLARRLEGLARHASVHAAGVVIADVPLDTLIPLYKPADGDDVMTQFEGPTVEKVGLLKMDFLGLRTLSQIHRAKQLVRQHHGLELDLEKADLADQKVYRILQRGETRGIFQFESGGMRDVLMKMKPNRIEDLIAANALFRPGPMEYIDEYVARKHGRDWTTPHPIMTEVLQETYGIMVYQEQVSRLVARLGDVPLRRAFRLAKAISKKKESMINAERGPFIEGCVAKGVSKETAEQIFADILKFGGYAFNKAHSTGYARVAFDTAYLKTYYPVEFMAAVLTYESGNTDKVAEYLDECRRIELPDGGKGIAVKPPDVNESDEAFTVVYPAGRDSQGRARGKGEIRFGLAAISGLGHKAIGAILSARRENGRFRDIFDFCERVDLSCVNKAAIEALIKAGAFDSTGAMRRALIEVVESAVQHGQAMQRDRDSGQMDMFGQFMGNAEAPPPPAIPSIEWSDAEMLAYEKATLGFFITRHPLTQVEQVLRTFSTVDTLGLRQMPAGAQVTLGAIVSKVRSVPIKTGRSAGKKLLVAVLEDFVGSIEAVIFPDQMPEVAALLKPDAVVFAEGEVDRRREEPSLRVNRIVPLAAAQCELARGVLLRLRSGDAPPGQLERVAELLRAHRGKVPVYLEIRGAEGWVATLRGHRAAAIEPHTAALRNLASLLGPDNVRCVGNRGSVGLTELPAAAGV